MRSGAEGPLPLPLPTVTRGGGRLSRELRGDERSIVSCRRVHEKRARRPFPWLRWGAGGAGSVGTGAAPRRDPPSPPWARMWVAFLVVICYFTFLGKGTGLSRPRGVSKLATAHGPNVAELVTKDERVLGPLSPVHIPQPSGGEGPPRDGPACLTASSPRWADRPRPSPRRLFPVLLVAPCPHVTGHPLPTSLVSGQWATSPGRPFHGLPHPKAHFPSRPASEPVWVCGSGREASNRLSPSPPQPLSPQARSRPSGERSADFLCYRPFHECRVMGHEFAFPVPGAEGWTATLGLSQ